MGLETDPDEMAGSTTSPYPDGGGSRGLGGPARAGGPAVPPPPPGFADWMAQWVAEYAPEIQRKAAEYGSNSLAKKGWRMAQVSGHNVMMGDALKLGIAQYAVEKADRVDDAMLRGTEASDDTWHDLAVYALMYAYVSRYGVWQ